MIERHPGEIYFTCDRTDCDEESELYDDSDDDGFAEAWASAKRRGWRAFKNANGQWEHRCPDCVGRD